MLSPKTFLFKDTWYMSVDWSRNLLLDTEGMVEIKVYTH